MAHVAVWRIPFWFMREFMREMFRWGSASVAASFGVAEKEDAYVYKAKLTLPEQVDADHAKAALANGELTLVLPKAAAVTPAPDAKLRLPEPVDAEQVKAALDNGQPALVVPKAAVTPAPVPAPAKKRRTTEAVLDHQRVSLGAERVAHHVAAEADILWGQPPRGGWVDRRGTRLG